jgi:long-chain acyl-CoA synthetase
MDRAGRSRDNRARRAGLTGAIPGTVTVVNIARYFAQHLQDPAKILYRHFVGDEWRDVSVREVAALASRWQKAYLREGFAAGDRIAICARNGVDWVAADVGALGLGLVVVPLYVDDNPDNAAWCARDAGARLLIAENSRVASGLRSAAAAGGALPPIVVLRAEADDAATSAERFLPGEGGEFELREQDAKTLATICFTSGTSGRPKGVMLSHGNIVANVTQCEKTGMARRDDLYLSILPLSHMFERTGGYYLPLSVGAKVAFCRGIPQIAEDLVSQKPTLMFAVPRILDRFKARIDQALATTPFKKKLFDACVSRGYRVSRKTATLADRLLAPPLRAIVGKPILARLGGRLRLAVVGGAALDPELARAFIGLGLPVLQGYGMTEASPVISVNRDEDNVPESVGPALPGVEVKLAENGELLARGGNIMLGYWNNDEATRQAIDPDGWLHTGDVAEIKDGKIFIRGRAKDIFVMSNGEKLSPQDVELAILHDPTFEQVMLIGDGRPYAALIAVTKDTDEAALVKRANAQLKAFPRWVRVRHVLATNDTWSVENGLLTPTLKLKRPLLLKRYADRIDAAYQRAPIE